MTCPASHGLAARTAATRSRSSVSTDGPPPGSLRKNVIVVTGSSPVMRNARSTRFSGVRSTSPAGFGFPPPPNSSAT